MALAQDVIDEMKTLFFSRDRSIVLDVGRFLGIQKQETPNVVDPAQLPPSNSYFIYFKENGVMYKLDEFGNETTLQGGAFITRLEDDDCDTTVEVERTVDDDHVYMRSAGTDRLIIEPTGPVKIPARTTGTLQGLVLVNGGNGGGDAPTIDIASPDGNINLRMFSDSAGASSRIKSRGAIMFHAGNTTIDGDDEDVRIDTAGNVGIHTTTLPARLNIRGNTVNTDPASFLMGGTQVDEGFTYTEVFQVSVSSQTEITRITGTGQNGFAGLVKITVTGHTTAVGNGGVINEYTFSATTVTLIRNLDLFGANAPTLTLALASNVLTIDLTSNGGVNTYNGIMKVEYFIPTDFSGNTWTVS